ncbi:DUF948 domain-containing protein [Patescibacteria group bacterium]|nr:DUF948 domain-containing protein [Patescibacteria group bacterium]
MLQTSSDVLYLCGSLALLAFTGFLCYFIYALTKTVQESQKTLEDVNGKLKRVDPVVDETVTTLTDINKSVQTINENVLKPIASLAGVVKGIKQTASNIKEGMDLFNKKKK